MISSFQHLISRYRRSGILVDTSLLLLYFVGRFAPDQITRFKRTEVFSLEDFKLLGLLLGRFERLLTTPNILSEVSNLSAQLGEPLRTAYFEKFETEIDLLHEQYVRSRDAVRDGCFVRLGLTDAVIHHMAVDSSHLVLTADLDLYLFLVSKQLDAINFNHLRPLGWNWLT